MRAPLRTALLGMSAAALLTALAAGGFLLHAPSMPEAAESAPAPANGAGTPAATLPSPDAISPPPRAGIAEDDVLPTPPEPPRLAEGPEYEACLTQLRGDPEGALARATKWDEQGGGDGAKHCLALSLLSLGEPAQAAGRLERLASQSSASGPARAAVFAQASQAWMMASDPNRAYGASTLALTLQPADTALLVDRAVAAAALGRYGEALQDLDVAVSQDASRVESLAFRAAALRHLDRTEDAMRDVDRALALNPRYPEALLERGILRQLKGDTTGARADWQRTIASAPDSAAADLAQQNLALNEAGPRRR